MTSAAHTPVNFLKSGDLGGFSAKCVSLLAEAGLTPDDFGDHSYMQERTRAARARREAYVAQQKAADQPVDPNGPDPHTAMLARSQSGHLSQDALFRSSASRGNACENHNPAADGYHSSMAPCMPMQSYGGRSSRPRSVIGSHHWAVGQNERAQAAGQSGQPADEAALSAACEANAGICTGDNSAAHRTHLANSSPFPATKYRKGKKAGQVKVSSAARTAEAADRADLHDAGRLAGADGEQKSAEGEGKLTGDSAAECIDAYRKAAMSKMKADVVDKYGKNYDQTKKDAEDELSAARAAQAARPELSGPLSDHAGAIRNESLATMDSLPPPRSAADQATYDAAQGRLRNSFLAAQQERGSINRRVREAEAEVTSVDCLNTQARRLCGQPPPPPSAAFTPPDPLPPAVSAQPEGVFP